MNYVVSLAEFRVCFMFTDAVLPFYCRPVMFFNLHFMYRHPWFIQKEAWHKNMALTFSHLTGHLSQKSKPITRKTSLFSCFRSGRNRADSRSNTTTKLAEGRRNRLHDQISDALVEVFSLGCLFYLRRHYKSSSSPPLDQAFPPNIIFYDVISSTKLPPVSLNSWQARYDSNFFC